MQQQPEYYSYSLDNNTTTTQPPEYYSAGPSHAIAFDQVDQAESSSLNTNTTVLRGGTDFRRRKNWSERILVEITGLLHVLSPAGKILYCSESTHELTGYRPHELVGQALMDFLHVDDMDVFIRDFQMSFHTRSQIKTHYRFRKKDDHYVIFEVVGHPKSDVPGQPPQSFFGIAQPIPTKSGALIDTFLELKAENNWLKKRIDELSSISTNSSITSSSNHHDNHENTIDINNTNKEDSDIEEFMPLNSQASTNNKPQQQDASDRKDKWKRRKHKDADEYVCADCGTTCSPEWRKGPHGPKTLCNACGLRWAKKNKKERFE